MVTVQLSLDRELSTYVQSEVLSGNAVSPEDFIRYLIKSSMNRKREQERIMEKLND